jgi:hypothetical protein
MIMDLIRWLMAWGKMPMFKFGWAFCIGWYCYQDMVRMERRKYHREDNSAPVKYPIEGIFMFNPYETILKDRKALIPAFRSGKYVGYYKVFRIYYDTGPEYKADLRLVKVAKET